jgi:hypothetical protein
MIAWGQEKTSAHLPAGHELPGMPGLGAKPGTPPANAPGAMPSARLPAGHELPGVQVPGAKPGTPPGNHLGVVPSAHLPAGHELPGVDGGPLLGTPPNPPGALSPRKHRHATQASPTVRGVSTRIGGNGIPNGAKATTVTPKAAPSHVGQQTMNNRPIERHQPRNHFAPSLGANVRPATASAGRAMTPIPQQLHQNALRHVQQPHPSQKMQQPHLVQQFQRPRPQQLQRTRPPSPRQPTCGRPGLLACR